MARKTNNSNQALTSLANQALVADETIKKQPRHYKHRSTYAGVKSKKIRKQRSTKRNAVAPTLTTEEEDADEEADGDDDDGTDGGEDDDREPAVLAPSARSGMVKRMQAGHSMGLDGTTDSPGSPEQAGAPQDVSPGQEDKVMKSVEVSEQGSQSDDSDAGYAGVDLISDSDEEEDPGVEKSEEKNIIESEEAEADGDASTSRAATSNASEALAGWESSDIPDGLLGNDTPYFDEQYSCTEGRIVNGRVETFSSASAFEGFSPAPTSSPRRVRFKTPVLSASDADDVMSNEEDEDLNALFRFDDAKNELEHASGEPDASLGDDEHDDGSCGSSSGYETDYGSTTDEEDVPATATTRPQSLLRNPSLSSVDIGRPVLPVPERNPSSIPTNPANLRRGPRMGTFTRDLSKPAAMVDHTGKAMVIFPAKKPAPVKTSLARGTSGNTTSAPLTPVTPHATLGTSPDLNDTEYTEMASQTPADPVLSKGPNLSRIDTMRLPHNISRDAVPHHVTQPPYSRFYPSDSAELSATHLDDVEEEIDEGEELLNVEDFIDFGETTSDDDGGKETSPASPTFASESDSKTSVAPRTKTSPSSVSSSQDLLKHFDTGVVTAFRRGQPSMYGSHYPTMSGHALSLTALKPTPPPHLLSYSAKRQLDEDLGEEPAYDTTPPKRRLIDNR